MSVSEQIEIIIPSSPEDRKALFEGIREMSNAMTRAEAEKEYIKESKKELSDKYGIAAKHITRMLNDYHKDTFDEKVKEHEEYQALYETIIE